MVDEKPRTLTRQLDAIPSELRAKPLKRRRVRLKPGDDQLERTTNELLSTVHERRVPHSGLLATTRKPLPAIVPSVKSSVADGHSEADDWLSHVGDDENRRRNETTTTTTRRKRERVSGPDPIFAETLPSSLDLRIPRTRAGRDVEDGVIPDGTRRRNDGADLNWLDGGGGGGVKKQPSTRRHRNGDGNSDIQRLIAEGEDKLALDGGELSAAKPSRRRTSRRSIDTLKFETGSSNNANSNNNNKSDDDGDDDASQIGRLSTSTFSEISSVSSKPPGRRRNNGRAELSADDEDGGGDDDLSASYDPSMLSLTSNGAKTRGERLTSNGGDVETNVFARPKRHKKRDPAAILRAGGGRREPGVEAEAPWPDLSDAKRSNGTRQSRGKMNAYRGKYLPPLTENLTTKNDKISF